MSDSAPRLCPWIGLPLALALVAAPLGCTDDGGADEASTTVMTLSGTTAGDGDGDGDASGDGDGEPAGCVGVEPLANEPPDDSGDGDGDLTGDGDGDLTGDGDGDGDPGCADCAPIWRLWDFQPQSCGYDQYYGLDSFEGHVTLVALLAGWCSYCQSQAQRMEQMRLELANEGYAVAMIAINAVSADNDDDRQNLVDRCSFPLFQDTDMQDSWSLHGGSKDDMFVYAADGSLAVELPAGGEGPDSTNLGTEEGYMHVKQALIDASE